ncbi:hypothetical protein O181_050703 [Austropuccinia psidii MF-1]|uniref:Tf2-1-like SH3-like domain-containing protein n=1 Tax=Austropuccinia psidii MF-1 TaxID=1389203 RepID=A0A9Q3E287_9BASI|nr:hypothetical protein [Austropuccinia psidii MF-1]
MGLVTALPASGDKSHNPCLVIVDRCTSKNPIFLPCHKDDTSMNTVLLLWNRVISQKQGKLFGTKLTFSTEYSPPTDGLAERMAQTLEDMIRIFCAYGLELKDSNGFNHDWCTLITALGMAYKTSVHSSTGQTPSMLEKGWNARPAAETLRKESIYIHPTASRYKIILDKKWDKSHKVPDLKVGDLVLVSTLKFDNIKGPKKLKDSYVGHFFIVALHGTNAVQVELSGKLENKHPTFPLSLIKPYKPAEKELFPLRKPTLLAISPVEQNEDKK